MLNKIKNPINANYPPCTLFVNHIRRTIIRKVLQGQLLDIYFQLDIQYNLKQFINTYEIDPPFLTITKTL